MKLFNILFNLKKKQLEPKMYVFLLRFSHFSQLNMQTDYTYEDALGKARVEFKEFLVKQQGVGAIEWHQIVCDLWISSTIFNIFGDHIDSNVQDLTPEEEDKNKIMAKILSKNDATLIEKYADKLTESDKKYLLDKIKTNETSKQPQK